MKSLLKIRENSKAGTVEFIQDIFGTAIQEWHEKKKADDSKYIWFYNKQINWIFFLELIVGCRLIETVNTEWS